MWACATPKVVEEELLWVTAALSFPIPVTILLTCGLDLLICRPYQTSASNALLPLPLLHLLSCAACCLVKSTAVVL